MESNKLTPSTMSQPALRLVRSDEFDNEPSSDQTAPEVKLSESAKKLSVLREGDQVEFGGFIRNVDVVIGSRSGVRYVLKHITSDGVIVSQETPQSLADLGARIVPQSPKSGGSETGNQLNQLADRYAELARKAVCLS